MLINEIVIVEKINFDPNKVQNTKGPDGTLYKWDKNDQSFTAPNGVTLASNSLLYRNLIKANPNAIKPGFIKRALGGAGLGDIGKASRSDPNAGIMQKTLGTGADALAKGVVGLGKLGKKLGKKLFRRNKQQGTTQPALKKGDRVSFISNHATSKGKEVMATVIGQSANNPEHYQVKSDTNPNPFLIPANRLTKIQA